MNTVAPAISQTTFFYSPASIVSIINAAIVIKEERKLVQVRGIFRKEGKMNYSGCYYNRIKDEANDNYLTLLTPALLHDKLEDNRTIELNGYITRKVNNRNASIEINLHLIELLNQQINKFSEEDVKKIDLVNGKLTLGFKDLDTCIKKAIFENRTFHIKVITGKSAIIDSDIRRGLGGALPLFQIEFVRVTLTSVAEITSMVRQIDEIAPNLICIARGGGENLDVFELPEIAECLLDCKTILATAIGHADNVTLAEKMADKKFITPTHFGTYLKEIYNNTVEELENSKAKLVQDITQTLSANYQKQIQNLEEQLIASLKLYKHTEEENRRIRHEELSVLQTKLLNTENVSKDAAQVLKDRIQALTIQQDQKDALMRQSNRQLEAYQRQIKESESKKVFGLAAIIIAIIIGIIIGAIITGKH